MDGEGHRRVTGVVAGHEEEGGGRCMGGKEKEEDEGEGKVRRGGREGVM